MGLALIACAELTCGVALPAAADASRPETDPVTTRDLQVSVGGLPSRPEPDGEVGRQTVTVNLRRAIDLALKANPELRAGSSDVEALEAQRDRAAGELWPSLRAIGAFTEYRRLQRLYPAAVSGEPAALSHHVAGADAVLSLPLFTGGRLRANLAAAERTRDAASHTLARTQAEIAFAVTGLYYALLAQRQLSAALASSEAGLVEQVRRLDALVRERKAAPLDRQRVEVRLAAVRQRRIQEENLKDIQLLSLGSLLGIDTAHTSLVVEGALARPAALPAATIDALLAKAFERREDYLSSLSSLIAQEARVGAARSAHWPQLSLLGSYGLRWSVAPSIEPSGVSPRADVGQLGLLVDVPLFLGGRVSADVREQQARLAAASERRRRLELRIRQEVGTALDDVRSARARADLAEDARSQAAEAYRIETVKYAAGKSTTSDVLVAQADLLDAEASSARALADVNTAIGELALATGDKP